jgi:hypothetical protein
MEQPNCTESWILPVFERSFPLVYFCWGLTGEGWVRDKRDYRL